MKSLKNLLFMGLLLGGASFAERVYVNGGRAGGYDTAYCPTGFTLESCEFNTNTCDNTSRGHNSCSADSRNNRPCNFTATCYRNEQHRVRIYGGRAGAYDTAYCPAGYEIENCSFDNNSCDNTSEGRNYCSADSRNNRQCRFEGVCVSGRRW